MTRIYLDHNATSPLRPAVRDAMIEAFGLDGNASSIHAEGRAAHSAIERARDMVAGLVNANPKNVIFTGGGTEANMTVLSPDLVLANKPLTQKKPPLCFLSEIEHPCVLSGGRFAAEQIVRLRVTRDGVVDLDSLRARLDEFCAFDPENESPVPFIVSVMLANNETGAVQPVQEIASLVHDHGGLMHTDAVQAAGKIPIDCTALGADFLTLSAHKLGGPQGVGALVLCSDNLVVGRPLLQGGGQEMKRRAGTENVAGIVGFGVAAQEAGRDLDNIERIAALRDQLETALKSYASELVVFSDTVSRLPNTTCLSVAGLTAELLLIGLDLEGIALSSGSACSSGKVDRSHVLTAMQVSPNLADGAVRISLGWNTAQGDIDHFVEAWSKLYDTFKRRHLAA